MKLCLVEHEKSLGRYTCIWNVVYFSYSLNECSGAEFCCNRAKLFLFWCMRRETASMSSSSGNGASLASDLRSMGSLATATQNIQIQDCTVSLAAKQSWQSPGRRRVGVWGRCKGWRRPWIQNFCPLRLQTHGCLVGHRAHVDVIESYWSACSIDCAYKLWPLRSRSELCLREFWQNHHQ